MANTALKTYGKDLVERAERQNQEAVFGRDEEIRRAAIILSRKVKNNLLLIGDPGVGKTAVVEGLAKKIAAGEVPPKLSGARIVELDVGALMTGVGAAVYTERLKSVLKEVEESKGKVIVFVDEFHFLVGENGNTADILKPALVKGELRFIGATTFKKYRAYVENDAALARRFKEIYVGEPSVRDSIRILRALKAGFENHHGVKIRDRALVAAVNLSNRYIAGIF